MFKRDNLGFFFMFDLFPFFFPSFLVTMKNVGPKNNNNNILPMVHLQFFVMGPLTFPYHGPSTSLCHDPLTFLFHGPPTFLYHGPLTFATGEPLLLLITKPIGT
jgi:hypothetical protein